MHPCSLALADRAHQSQPSLHVASPVSAGKNFLTVLWELLSNLSVSVILPGNAVCAVAAPWVHLPVFVHLGSAAALTLYSVGISNIPVCDQVAVK